MSATSGSTALWRSSRTAVFRCDPRRAIGHVSPEAAAGGPIAFIEDGDLISYSVENRTINLTGIHGVPCSVEEASKVLAERAKAGILPREPRKGFYKLYTDHALSAMKGAGLE